MNTIILGNTFYLTCDRCKQDKGVIDFIEKPEGGIWKEFICDECLSKEFNKLQP